jgi:aspartyl/asparaginyl-tRNA synthetase
MTVTDMTGRVVINKMVAVAGEIKTSALSSGIYFISIRDQQGTYIETEKFIIQ